MCFKQGIWPAAPKQELQIGVKFKMYDNNVGPGCLKDITRQGRVGCEKIPTKNQEKLGETREHISSVRKENQAD